ncbi:L,D-transpeptidase family protein [Zhaonella formicivorans]|uniref:L,D-transpeptidase family protein n=1 Tax=Zhaonella formicivorans TaxID=2528593 RepID=UPI0010DF92E2|nr:L,D-transpeptidase family protein [Zhaonella formicivorans]
MKRIVIDLNSRHLSWYKGNSLIKTYPVAIGKPSTPTPTGSYQVVNKIINPGGVLGTRWMGLDIPTDDGSYGIHGTNNPTSIGQAISNGCIRMYNHDVEELFPQVKIGTPVDITGSYSGVHFNPPGDNLTPGLNGKIYIVRPGDSLWKIAQLHGVTLEALINANNLASPDLIYPGQRIIIPAYLSYLPK